VGQLDPNYPLVLETWQSIDFKVISTSQRVFSKSITTVFFHFVSNFIQNINW